MKKNLIIFIGIVILSFILNLFWENIQMSLYTGYRETSLFGINCLLATFGDIIIIFALYSFVALKNKNFAWFTNASKIDYLLLSGLGVLIAILIEKFALATNRWGYAETMPIIPIVDVGVAPVLQMLLLPVITVAVIKLIYKEKNI